MTVTRLTTAVSVRATFGRLVDSDDLPAWVRVGCIAWHHANTLGHARLATGELRRTLGLNAQQTSNAVAIAKARGWIDHKSNARCLVLPDCGLNPCEEPHR